MVLFKSFLWCLILFRCSSLNRYVKKVRFYPKFFISILILIDDDIYTIYNYYSNRIQNSLISILILMDNFLNPWWSNISDFFGYVNNLFSILVLMDAYYLFKWQSLFPYSSYFNPCSYGCLLFIQVAITFPMSILQIGDVGIIKPP